MYTLLCCAASGQQLAGRAQADKRDTDALAPRWLNFINHSKALTPRLGNSPKKCPPPKHRGKPGRAARCHNLLLPQTQTCREQISWHPSTKASCLRAAARAAPTGAAAANRQPCTHWLALCFMKVPPHPTQPFCRLLGHAVAQLSACSHLKRPSRLKKSARNHHSLHPPPSNPSKAPPGTAQTRSSLPP